MIRFLIQRPIAVLMTFGVMIITGALAIFNVPISLLPDIDVPQITIKINYPDNSAELIERETVKPIRENLLTLYNLKEIESTSSNHSATINLLFEYGTRMDLAFIEVNEKIDQITDILPKDLARPRVARMNTSDIPVVRLQVIPKSAEDYLQISDLTEKVIKKRIEQIDGVSLVDLNGTLMKAIEITPVKQKLVAASIQEQDLIAAIQQHNNQLGSLSIRDGHYQYFVKIANTLKSVADFENIPVTGGNGLWTKLNELAVIREVADSPSGCHLFNGNRGLVITIRKEHNARMNDLVRRIKESVKTFEKDYPQIDFFLTQDQSFLLDASIGNLYQALIFGSICCVILLFLYSDNFALPLLMGISIPSSLAITFIFFYLFGISFNIISLSGLALGIGMLIDNSIVVLDRIFSKHKSGLSKDDSCIIGIKEVASPVIGTVLTTMAVYLPLIYLSGLAGALIKDQAIALTISLMVSLLIAFFLNPVLYRILLKNDGSKLKGNSKLYLITLAAYHRMINLIFKRKKLFLFFTILTMPVGIIIGLWLPVKNLPFIDTKENLLLIDWNEPIRTTENEHRINQLIGFLEKEIDEWEADVGVQQFLNGPTSNSSQRCELYCYYRSSKDKSRSEQKTAQWLQDHYPLASYSIQSSKNAFTQLFEDKSPYFEARFKQSQTNNIDFTKFKEELHQHTKRNWEAGLGALQEDGIEITIDTKKLGFYNITYKNIQKELELLLGNNNIAEIEEFGDVRAVHIKLEETSITDKLKNGKITVNNMHYPLNNFIDYSMTKGARYITADRTGVYKSFILRDIDSIEKEKIGNQIKNLANKNGLSVELSGRFYKENKLVKDMAFIFLISLLLLFFILAIEFDNLIQPLLVMLTIPLGIFGAILLLFLSGGQLDVMSAIGFVVVLGIIVDDPILKIETINRLRKKYDTMGLSSTLSLEKAIIEAGEICLKPVLLTSLTTVLALLPLLFIPGIGSDLQKPMVWVVTGGLIIGTFLVLWFLPLAYWYVSKKK